MQILFKKIRVHNFFSFADAELDLNDMGYTLVEGRNNCKLDNAYSNGSGKSSIFNAICFALTGETSQGVSTGIENIFSDPADCWVELTLYVNNDEFVIKRYKTPWPKMTITVNGEDKSGKGIRESSKLLASYIPDLTPTLINSIIILGQGLPNRFTNNNPARRKEILETLTKSDFMIQSIKDKLDIRQGELKDKLRSNEDASLSLTSQLHVYERQLNSNLDSLSQFDSEESIELRLDSLRKELDEITKEINEYSVSISENTRVLDELNIKKNRIIDEYSKKISDTTSIAHNDVKDYENHSIELRVEIKDHEKEIKKLDSITDVCPTCGQKIPNIKLPDTKNLKNELSDLKAELDDITAKINIVNRKRDNEIEKLNDEKNKLIESIDVKIKEIKPKIPSLELLKDRATMDQISLNNQISILTNYKINYNTLVSTINDLRETIKNLNEDITKITGDIATINAHLEVIQQMITLAKREFRGVLLINIISYLNKKMKQYSMNVFGTEEIDFKLDENAIDISYNGKPYENLSGGEKQKIDVIVQIALRDVLSKQLDVRSNLLVLDEIFDNLDSQGCSKIMNLISSLTDIDSVFIISHHAQDLELTKDNGILVEKDEDGISSIKIV